MFVVCLLTMVAAALLPRNVNDLPDLFQKKTYHANPKGKSAVRDESFRVINQSDMELTRQRWGKWIGQLLTMGIV